MRQSDRGNFSSPKVRDAGIPSVEVPTSSLRSLRLPEAFPIASAFCRHWKLAGVQAPLLLKLVVFAGYPNTKTCSSISPPSCIGGSIYIAVKKCN